MKFLASIATLIVSLGGVALAQSPAPAETPKPATAAPAETSASTAAPQAASVAPQSAATAVTQPKKPLTKVPGYKRVKRDGQVFFCRKDASIGSRLETMKCFSEAEMEVQLAMQQEERDNMHQRMRTCVGVCGSQ
jgi:hypothetical protein